jgi:hypothetical protein
MRSNERSEPVKGSIFVISAAVGLCAAPAIADHNSKQGEGWANMPNDIHNTRIHTLEANDNEAFRDFVKHGEGSESINRFDSDDTTAQAARGQKGKAATGQAQGRQQAGTRRDERAQKQRPIRPEGGPGAGDRQRSMRERDTGYRAGNRGGDRQREHGGRGRN